MHKHTSGGYCQIHLASDEWGNDSMRDVAQAYFEEHPECNFVMVIEHAGWCLGFRRDGSLWGTANDMAKPDGREKPDGYAERVIRRETGSDHWMIAEIPELKVVA